MNLNEFQELSRRTMQFGGNPNNDVERNFMLVNYSLGIIGEAVETLEAFNQNMVLDNSVETLLKEVGDVSHYAVGLAALFHLKLPEEIPFEYKNMTECMHGLLSNAKDISEYTKKYINHDHDDPFPVKSLMNVFSALNMICEVFGRSYSEVLQMNIDKLKNRYPKGFNAEDSKNRVDVTKG